MMERRVKERLVGATILVALIVLIVPELLSGPKRPTVTVPPLAQGLPASTRSVSVDLTTNRATASADAEAPGVATPGVATPGNAASDTAPGAAGSADGSGAARANEAEGAASAAGHAATTAHLRAPDDSTAGDASRGEAASATATPGQASQPAQDSAPTVTTLRAQEPSSPALESHGAPPKSAVSASAPKSAAGDPASARHAWAVQLGSFANRSNAEKLMRQLQARGGPNAYVVSSGSGSSLRYRVRMGPLGDRAAAERTVAKLKAGGHPATIVTPAS